MTNICRCGTYNRVRAAIKAAASRRREGRRPRHRARRREAHMTPLTMSRRQLPWRRSCDRWRARRRLPHPIRGRSRCAGAVRRRNQCLGCRQAGRHGRDQHRPLRNGAGNADRVLRNSSPKSSTAIGRRCSTEFPTPGQNLARKRVWGNFSTGGSRGIRDSQEYVRKGGAAARVMLVQAAADGWKVPASECVAAKSVITHTPSGRTDDLRQGRGQRPPSSRRRRTCRSRIRRTGRSPASASHASTPRTRRPARWSTASTSRCPAC